MAYEQRDNSGTIFVNDRKEKDTHPDRTGTAMIDGVMYYVSGWIKTGAKGKFMSLAFKRKDDDQPRGQSISQRAQAKIRRPDPISSGLQKVNIIPDDDMDGDRIPF